MITFKWDYTQRTVQLSMPGYIEETLKKFGKFFDVEKPLDYRSKLLIGGGVKQC